eukprot:TRINITY_DN1173_c0_g1_i1.p1 TRINITY_DN1173_c0_g1~~TRINITY_DN1173_c0_g1_i1.p1  ORF type:complete len:323 (+),score=17.08 TRINITY_DN1173_c0_g1_i1:25-969(+)
MYHVLHSRYVQHVVFPHRNHIPNITRFFNTHIHSTNYSRKQAGIFITQKRKAPHISMSPAVIIAFDELGSAHRSEVIELVQQTGRAPQVIENSYENFEFCIKETLDLIVNNKAQKAVLIFGENSGINIVHGCVICIGAGQSNFDKIKEAVLSWLNEDQQQQSVNLSTSTPTAANFATDIECYICKLSQRKSPKQPIHGDGKRMGYEDVPGVQGAKWKLYREDHTTALVKFPKGAREPPHHHSIGHSVFIYSGEKTVTNHTTGQTILLKKGDFLYTPATQSHTVEYHTEVEFFFQCDGQFDMYWDGDEKQVYIPA